MLYVYCSRLSIYRVGDVTENGEKLTRREDDCLYIPQSPDTMALCTPSRKGRNTMHSLSTHKAIQRVCEKSLAALCTWSSHCAHLHGITVSGSFHLKHILRYPLFKVNIPAIIFLSILEERDSVFMSSNKHQTKASVQSLQILAIRLIRLPVYKLPSCQKTIKS